MSIPIRLEHDVVAYLRGQGQFGESYSDVLRRLLPGLEPKEPSRSKKGAVAPYPQVYGHSLTSVVRALGAMGWSVDDASRALLVAKGINANPAMVKTQIAWGRQWGKGNPRCDTGVYGSKPPVLTSKQLAGLSAALER